MLRNVINYLRFLPKSLKLTVAVGLATLLIATPFMVNASWSPARPVLDWNNPAERYGFDHPVFNSYINTPVYGDERTFFDVRDASVPSTTSGGFVDQVDVDNGQELVLRTYVHNNANQTLNASGAGIAHDTQVRVVLPTAQENTLRALSYISASNATPQAVSDTVDLVNDVPFAVEYVPGSAQAFTNAVPNGYQVADSIVNGGAQVGYTGANGEVPGCFEFE